MNVLILTTEWPTDTNPGVVPFLVQHVKFLREAGVAVEVFHFQGKRKPFNYLRAWFAVRRLKAWKNADLLHAHWGQSAFPSLFSQKKLVITFHGSDLWGIVNKQGNFSSLGKVLVGFSKWIAKRADCCIVVSKHLQGMLPERVRCVRVLPMGVDVGKFHPMEKQECRRSLGMDQHEKIILFFGDPQRQEKFFTLAEKGVSIYDQAHPEESIRLLLIHGVEHDQIPALMNAGDVLILTSKYEGASTVVKEALACGLPIVSFDVGDVKERISQIEGCFVCEDQTIECLAKGLAVALAHNGRIVPNAAALHQLDERQNVQELIKIYQKVIEG